jgi:hypothetical protein
MKHASDHGAAIADDDACLFSTRRLSVPMAMPMGVISRCYSISLKPRCESMGFVLPNCVYKM